MKQTITKTLGVLLALLLVVSLTACAQEKEPAPTAGPQTLKIGATVTPHGEVLEYAKEALKEKGIEIEIVEFNEYTLINPAVDSGELDANYFQHISYLNDFNEKNGTKLISAGKIHYEPYGLYGGKLKSLDELKEGSSVAVPNDATNEARALLLLEQAGLIKLKEGAGILATIHDIEENPKNLEIVELAAEQIPRALQDVDFAVINGNYAIAAGLNVAKDALVIESAEGEAAEVYANIVAIKEDRAGDEAIKMLVEVLQSDEIAQWITDNYGGAVLPVK
ncbi:MAG: ABC transporter substrate-binding protein [Tissierellia bacterium]|nr:MetQ/NlpA family ABC transporter substrate-binding protein [Bacillota bacterium]NLL22508.1 ABC transporter substrate-binding protein [Tissierellia bacterium]